MWWAVDGTLVAAVAAATDTASSAAHPHDPRHHEREKGHHGQNTSDLATQPGHYGPRLEQLSHSKDRSSSLVVVAHHIPIQVKYYTWSNGLN